MVYMVCRDSRDKLRGWWHWQVITISRSLTGQSGRIACNIEIRNAFVIVTVIASSMVHVSCVIVRVVIVIVRVVWLCLFVGIGLSGLLRPPSKQNLLLSVNTEGPSSSQVQHQILDSLSIQLYQLSQLMR